MKFLGSMKFYHTFAPWNTNIGQHFGKNKKNNMKFFCPMKCYPTFAPWNFDYLFLCNDILVSNKSANIG